MNNITLMGHLTKVPELRNTQSGTAVTSFTLAVDRPRRDGAINVDFIDCVAWKGTAEFVSKYFEKGQMMAVTGRLQMRDWTDKDGNKRRNAEVMVHNVFFTGDRRKDDHDDVEFEEVGDEEALPF